MPIWAVEGVLRLPRGGLIPVMAGFEAESEEDAREALEIYLAACVVPGRVLRPAEPSGETWSFTVTVAEDVEEELE